MQTCHQHITIQISQKIKVNTYYLIHISEYTLVILVIKWILVNTFSASILLSTARYAR